MSDVDDVIHVCHKCQIDLQVSFKPKTSATYDANAWADDNENTKYLIGEPPLESDKINLPFDAELILEKIVETESFLELEEQTFLQESGLSKAWMVITEIEYSFPNFNKDNVAYMVYKYYGLDYNDYQPSNRDKPKITVLDDIDDQVEYNDLDLDSTMCCDKPVSDCECKLDPGSYIFSPNRPTFLQTYNTLQNVIHPNTLELFENAYVYEQDAGEFPCASCSAFGTYKCVPLRDWMRNVADDHTYQQALQHQTEKGGEIEPCTAYQPSVDTPVSVIQYIYDVYLHDHFYEESEEMYDEEVEFLD